MIWVINPRRLKTIVERRTFFWTGWEAQRLAVWVPNSGEGVSKGLVDMWMGAYAAAQ